MRHQAGSQHRRNTGIAAKAHHRCGVDAREDLSCLEHTAGQGNDSLARAQRPAAGNSRAAYDEVLEPGEHRGLNAARARIGHQRHAPTTGKQLACQRLGRKEVAAGSAGRDHHGKYCRSSHGTSP